MRCAAMPSTLLDAPTLAALHNPDVTPSEIRRALTCLVERMAEDAAPAFGMLLELDSQARELGISVPALEDDEFARAIALSPSDEPQSAVRAPPTPPLLLHQRAERAAAPGWCSSPCCRRPSRAPAARRGYCRHAAEVVAGLGGVALLHAGRNCRKLVSESLATARASGAPRHGVASPLKNCAVCYLSADAGQNAGASAAVIRSNASFSAASSARTSGARAPRPPAGDASARVHPARRATPRPPARAARRSGRAAGAAAAAAAAARACVPPPLHRREARQRVAVERKLEAVVGGARQPPAPAARRATAARRAVLRPRLLLGGLRRGRTARGSAEGLRKSVSRGRCNPTRKSRARAHFASASPLRGRRRFDRRARRACCTRRCART